VPAPAGLRGNYPVLVSPQFLICLPLVPIGPNFAGLGAAGKTANAATAGIVIGFSSTVGHEQHQPSAGRASARQASSIRAGIVLNVAESSFSTAVRARTSPPVSSVATFVAPMLSLRCSSDLVPGIGTITGERRRSQARATADVESRVAELAR
jgi:hypothetical protein